MKNNKDGKLSATKCVALSGVMSALCFVIMYLVSVTEIFDLSGVVVCSMIIIVAVIEIGRYYPWLIWAVTGVLCLFFLPKKDIALEFVMFGGIYPMMKSYFEKLPTIPSWILKIVFFNAVFTGWFFICRYLFGIKDVGFTFGLIAYAAANVFFILSDIAFSMMIALYMSKLRKKLKIGKNK